MASDSGHNSERTEQLLDAVVSYLEEMDEGRAPDSRAVLARHPDLQDELTVFFADEEKIGGLLAPLRAPAPGALVTQEEPGPGQDTTGPYQPQEEDGNRRSGSVVPLPSIPGYEVLGVLGQGGMGIVYKARHVALDRLAALKMIRSQRLADDSVRTRFRTEARAVAQFDHPNLVRVHEYGEAKGQPYFALEFVPGGSLAERCKDDPLPPRAVAALMAPLTDAVAYAHRRGILHRDLKPANVLLAADGVPKITDFGLVKDLRDGAADLTQPGARIGTPAYFSPEQAQGRSDAIGPETDIFGLGGILYFLLTGRPPFQGKTVGEVVEQARQGQVRPPRQLNGRVPRALERICLKALAADPRQRYPSAAALGDDLRRYVHRPRRVALAAGALIVLLAVAGLLGLKALLPPGPRESTDNTGAPLASKLDVRVWKKADTTKGLTLAAPGVLPLRTGDWMRVEAESNRPAYLYVIYLDAQGEASPLFPWQTWDKRSTEQKRTQLHLPEDPLKDGAPLEPGPSGIEAVLVLAREEPLSAEEVGTLRRLFPKVPPGKFDPLRGAVWLGAEERFADVRDRGRPNLDQSGTVPDPVERLRRLVRGELKRLSEDVRGVCYPFEGK
jgi:serine/threonine-protein kinase